VRDTLAEDHHYYTILLERFITNPVEKPNQAQRTLPPNDISISTRTSCLKMMRIGNDALYNTGSSLSPVNVVDFASLIEIDASASSKLLAPELKQRSTAMMGRHHHHHQKPRHIFAASAVDSITADCTTDEDDDNDDLVSFSSSISSHEDDEQDEFLLVSSFGSSCSTRSRGEEDRRSIFSHYWNTTGEQPLDLIHEHSNLSRSKSNAQLSLLDKEEVPAAAPVSPRTNASSSSRRSIFGSSTTDLKRTNRVNTSMRSLQDVATMDRHQSLENTRRSQSISCMRSSSERLPSCLRNSSREKKLSPSNSSVSFDAQVQVITYETPLENWSDGSWTKFFGF